MSGMTIEQLVLWHEQRAMVERSMGRNQLAAGNDVGQWRVDRADAHAWTAAILREISPALLSA
jgi:hypothetical protein